jgi:uncharacterized membrane protein
VTLLVIGVVFLAPLTAGIGRWHNRLLGGGLLCGAVALGTTKFPDEVPTAWGRTSFNTVMWMLHLLGGALWIGGLVGMLLIALPGAVDPSARGPFWSATIRRFSAIAMSSVAAIGLSGLFLYWEHVDGPSQLFSTMYGRVLGVKILIFGVLLMLGVVNQFWLHPRIEACRASGDQRPLPVLLLSQFRAVIASEVVLGLSVLLVAPFLHGSARNQAFQAEAAKQLAAGEKLKRIASKDVTASTWIWGITETLIVIAVMLAGYYLSGRIVRRRANAAPPAELPAPSVAER